MKSPTSTSWQYLSPNPNSCYKQLFVKGTRIRARVLFGMFMSASEPMTAREIAEEYDLPLEAVHEAIAYCQSNPPEIEQDAQREERFMEASGMNEPDYVRGGKFKVVPPGIIVIRQDNDPTRDMTPKGIVNALQNLEQAGVPIQDEFIILNHWR